MYVKPVQIIARINPKLKKAVMSYCKKRGFVFSSFVQEALIDRLEELEDIEDVKHLRSEPTRSLEDVLSEIE